MFLDCCHSEAAKGPGGAAALPGPVVWDYPRRPSPLLVPFRRTRVRVSSPCGAALARGPQRGWQPLHTNSSHELSAAGASRMASGQRSHAAASHHPCHHIARGASGQSLWHVQCAVALRAGSAAPRLSARHACTRSRHARPRQS
eukprot:356411-Chlamydomonas_euryale.AAC.3